MTEICSVCSSPVQTVGDPDEGTMHYEPAPQVSIDEHDRFQHMQRRALTAEAELAARANAAQAPQQFTADELSLIAHLADATLSLYRGLLDYPTSERTVGQIEALQVKAASLAFVEVSRDA